jgi:hypothetical protein
MKLFARSTVVSLCAFAALSACAQTPDPMKPPKVLVIDREYLKPGKSGSLHEKSESAFVKAMAAAKWPFTYIAMDSLTGVNRTLFVTAYDSFADWEKDLQGQDKNAALSAAESRAWIVDGDLLSSADQGAFALREDLSAGPPVEIANMRYFDITMYKIKPGHEKEWDELVKIYKDGYTKAAPDVPWATYESMYGADNGGMFLVIVPMKSIADIDKSFGDAKKFEGSIGESGVRRVHELTAACVASTQDNLFHFNPKMSYPGDHLKTVDPDFWVPKPAPPTKAQ